MTASNEAPTDCTVWWLYGPPCVGKSATAWELYANPLVGHPRAYFDVDQVGMCYPERDSDPGRYRLKVRAAAVLVRRFAQAGARRVIVSGVLDEDSLHEVAEQVHGLPVTFVRLRAEPAELRRRLRTRYGPDDVARALMQAQDWDRRDMGHVVIDTDGRTPRDVAAHIREVLSEPSAAPVPTCRTWDVEPIGPVSPASTPGRAVLLCGPTAVGKSTVGYGFFTRLRHAGIVTAYVDLQQLSFFTPAAPSGHAGGHRLTAACVTDLWAEFRAAGARQLVLTGHVDRPEDVQLYRTALGDTPLLVCRLAVSRDQLRKRIAARMRGEGPELARDLLRGQSPSDAETVVEHALAQQDRLQEAGIGDLVIDADVTPHAAERALATLLAIDDD